MIRVIAFIIILVSLPISASSNIQVPINGQLIQFAKANCLYQYFQHKNYDLNDIRNISAGIVQTSSLAPETFVEVSRLVKNYEPEVKYKKDTSPLLVKCFTLDSDPVFLRKINSLTHHE